MSAFQVSRPATVLFIDDDPDVRISAELLLRRRGMRMLSAQDETEAWSVLAAERVDVILLDMNFAPRATTGDEGLGLLKDILRRDPTAAVVVVTGHSGVNIAVASIRAGARDFIMKPWSNERLASAVEEALGARDQGPERGAALADPAEDAVILGADACMARLRDQVARAATLFAPVLIRGEAGAGKSLAARAIHRAAGHADRPFVVADLAGAPAHPADEAAFIHARLEPAFHAARGGDLVLDEVGALTASLQGQLIGLLDTLGPPGAASARVIATTALARERPGALRPDLLFRLDTLEIEVAPLRGRTGDIALLADHFARLYARLYSRPQRRLSEAALERLALSAWPDNVRALRRMMERVVILTDVDPIGPAELHAAGSGAAPATAEAEGTAPTLARSERALIEAALKRHGFNVTHAAQDLGLSRASLYRRMAKHDL